MSVLRRLQFASRDSYTGSTNMLGATPYMSRKPLKGNGPAEPLLEDIVMALGAAVELQRNRDGISGFRVATWEQGLPAGVALDRQLAGSKQRAAGPPPEVRLVSA